MPRAGEAAGFTLVELLVVLLVIALALGAAIPFLARGPDGQRLDAVAAELVGALRKVRADAIRSNGEALFVVAPEARTWRAGETAEPESFPANVVVRAVGARSEMPTEHLIGIRFFADGTSTGGSITLEQGDAPALRVAVDWLTGRVQVER